MFVKKVILIGAFITILLIAGNKARPATAVTSNQVIPFTTTSLPNLSGDITISALNNEQVLPAVAYNWKHDEYLVVWQNTWGWQQC